ncbi:MAG: M23 family metallopeptidase [Longimicrobiales bacterium]
MLKQTGTLVPLLVAALSVGAATKLWARKAAPDPATAPLLEPVYAAPLETIETHTLERGETLTDVLVAASIGGADMAELLLGVREHVNPRRLPGGTEITVRRWASNLAMRGVELRVNADTTLRLRREEYGWTGRLVLTPVVLDTVFTGGEIRPGQTLYEAVVMSGEGDVPVGDRITLVYRLAELFEYKIDFNREIQVGDAFRLVYEREARPDGTARAQRIMVAEIVNQGKSYGAVLFAKESGQGDYYDREGRPLAAGFSRYPVAYRITSSFSTRRYHPVLGIYRAHLGTDFGAPSGAPVQATADGTVKSARRSGSYGNLVTIRHANGFETRYAHLSRFAKGIRAGAKVSQKQVIGYVGRTGLATGPHLHYELRRGGKAINARTAKLPDAPPIAPEYRADFDRIALAGFALLDAETERWMGQLARAVRIVDEN